MRATHNITDKQLTKRLHPTIPKKHTCRAEAMQQEKPDTCRNGKRGRRRRRWLLESERHVFTQRMLSALSQLTARIWFQAINRGHQSGAEGDASSGMKYLQRFRSGPRNMLARAEKVRLGYTGYTPSRILRLYTYMYISRACCTAIGRRTCARSCPRTFKET